jgi:hypothetical protein
LSSTMTDNVWFIGRSFGAAVVRGAWCVVRS